MTSLRVRDLEVLLTHRSLCVCGPHETGTPTDLHEQYPDAWSGRAGGERFPRASGPAPSSLCGRDDEDRRQALTSPPDTSCIDGPPPIVPRACAGAGTGVVVRRPPLATQGWRDLAQGWECSPR